MADVTEIAADIFRISVYEPAFAMQFNQYLVRDDEPLLFHSGLRRHFDESSTALAALIDPAQLRWIGFSHFEADECGAVPLWQATAAQATPLCSLVGKMVSVDDTFPETPARGLDDNETFSTGRHTFRFLRTAHVPHGWDAGLLLEEDAKVLFCSDLFTHRGNVPAETSSDIAGRFAADARADAAGPFAHAYPFDTAVERTLERLKALAPRTLALMHGSTFHGDGAAAIEDLTRVLQELDRTGP